MTFWQTLLAIGGALIAMWFFIIWLPHRLHVINIGRKYGWPSKKRATIGQLFLDGTLTAVGYAGGTFDPNQEFQLIIVGPFGTFIQRGTGNTLLADKDSVPLPPKIATAFSGYLDRASDVVWLLWYLPFLQELQQKGRGKFKIGGDMPRSLAITSA